MLKKTVDYAASAGALLKSTQINLRSQPDDFMCHARICVAVFSPFIGGLTACCQCRLDVQNTQIWGRLFGCIAYELIG